MSGEPTTVLLLGEPYVDAMSDSPRDDRPDDGPRNDPRPPEAASPDEEEGNWAFGVDEVGPDGRIRETIEPGSVSVENVFFVAVGVVGTLLVILTAI